MLIELPVIRVTERRLLPSTSSRMMAARSARLSLFILHIMLERTCNVKLSARIGAATSEHGERAYPSVGGC